MLSLDTFLPEGPSYAYATRHQRETQRDREGPID